MFTVSLTEYAPIAVYFLALERFVTAKKSSQESALQGPSCTYRPGLAVLVLCACVVLCLCIFTTTNHTNSSQYSLPWHSIPKSAFQLTNPTGIKRRYYQHAGVFNACIDLRLTRTQKKKKNCRGQLESRSLTKIYLPRAICITRSFSSWLSFNMVVRTGTKCSLSFGRHFRNCNMTFLRYSRFACSFSRSWFLSSLKKIYIWLKI